MMITGANLMGQFDEFELRLEKIGDYPLVYDVPIPAASQFFQDVRRYQHSSAHLEVRIIDVDGRITAEPDMVRVPISKLSTGEKKALIAYLKKRLSRGDNMGSDWAFFRPSGSKRKKPVTGYGVNIVHGDPQSGRARAARLLSLLEKDRTGKTLILGLIKYLLILTLILGAGFGIYKYGYLEKSFFFNRLNFDSDSPEMSFYKQVFPQVFSWTKGSDHEQAGYTQIAHELLRPEYIQDMQAGLSKDFYRMPQDPEHNIGNRLILFVYFNYNTQIRQAIKQYRLQLEGTEFMRLARIYSCDLSNYASNVFYFKVGDLNIAPSQVSDYVSRNLISLTDFTKIRDNGQFSDLLQKDDIGFQMKRFLEDVYTFSPLRVDASFENIFWYLLTRKDKAGKINFAAFFTRKKATLIPRDMSNILLHHPDDPSISWYLLGEDAAANLKLSSKTLRYFSRTAGQGKQLDIISDRIVSLGLTRTKKPLPVAVHRELLMEDNKGKYAIRCTDPITSLVLSNLITRGSFEKELPLKRDPIQMNTCLVQLSRDDSLSIQATTITPGKTGIARLFEPIDSFPAVFADGTRVLFEKPEKNLFSSFPFTVFNDSITFGGKQDISGMTMELGKVRLQILRSEDGNYRIEKIN